MGQQKAYIFVGPPGSGKGSLSKLCVEHFGWMQLSTGDLCRRHIAEKTPIGQKIDFVIKSGKLIPDELVVSMVDEWMARAVFDGRSIILDGFPRNLVQAKRLFCLLSEKYHSIQVEVVKFLISDSVAVDRICNRYICKNKQCQMVYSSDQRSNLCSKKGMECERCSSELGKRDDDVRDTVLKRLEIYRGFEQEIQDCLEDGNNKVFAIDVERPLDVIFNEFKCELFDVNNDSD